MFFASHFQLFHCGKDDFNDNGYNTVHSDDSDDVADEEQSLTVIMIMT